MPSQTVTATSNAMQRADGYNYYRDLTTYHAFDANPSSTIRHSAGIKFSGLTIPQGTPIRAAYLRLNAGYAGTTGINCLIRVENADEAADYAASGPGPNDVNSRTLLSGSIAWLQTSAPIDEPKTLPFDLTPLVQQVVDRPGWNPSGTNGIINIILQGQASGGSYTSRHYTRFASFTDNRPQLIVEWGPADPAAVEFDLITLGDSWTAFAGHSGFVRPTTPVPLFTGCSYSKLPAGAAGDSYNFYGIGADFKRGFTNKGVVQDKFEEYFSELNIKVKRNEFAIGGSTAASWAVPTYSGWTYGPSGKTANDVISSPPTGNALIFMSLGGNDLVNLSKSGGGKIYPEDTANWNAMFNQVQSDITSVLNNIFTLNPGAYVIFMSYTRMRLIDANPSAWVIYPNSNSLNFNQVIWGVPGFGFAGQAAYDMQLGVPTSNGSYPLNTHDESTHWRFTAYRQQYSYGIGPPPNQAHYSWSLAAADTNPNFLAQVTWFWPDYPSGAVIDGWKDSFRNITDLRINPYWYELLLRQQAACSSFPNVIFVNAWDAIGVDTVYTADPSSLYAQSPNDYWSDWLHLDKDGYGLWALKGIETAAPSIPFLSPLLGGGSADNTIYMGNLRQRGPGATVR